MLFWVLSGKIWFFFHKSSFFFQLLQNQGFGVSDHSSVHNSPLPSPASLVGSRPTRSSSLSGPYAKIVEGTITSLNNTSLSSSAPSYEKAPGSGRRSSSKESEHPQVMCFSTVRVFFYYCFHSSFSVYES